MTARMNQLPEPPFWNPLATQNEKDPTVNPGKFSWMGSDGRVYFDLHEGQEKALESEARFIAIIAGTQSGKTESGPPWLCNEIAKRGPGDYIVASPTYPLLQKKVLPAFIELFDTKLKLGRYFPGSKQFKFSKEGSRRIFGRYVDEKTIVFFGHAQDPESLESATAKAAWLDEAGQRKFKLASWEALQRRLAMHIGRAFITTTPYDLGWLKKQIYDRWKAGDKDYEVINFRSTMNPAFSLKEYNRAKRTLPPWKFDLFYNGIFTRPAGAIYDCFEEIKHTCPRFAIPDHWERLLGVDFGGINTAGVFFAKEPNTGRLFGYREYNKNYFNGVLHEGLPHTGGTLSCKKHVENLLTGEVMIPYAVGGAKSENQWREEMRSAGLPVREPDQNEVEIGIGRVYGGIKENLVVFFDDLIYTLDEFSTYSREMDDQGEVTEEIEDKETYHHLDACRYILGDEFRDILTWKDMKTGEDHQESVNQYTAHRQSASEILKTL